VRGLRGYRRRLTLLMGDGRGGLTKDRRDYSFREEKKKKHVVAVVADRKK
jgi:hypothetical protein